MIRVTTLVIVILGLFLGGCATTGGITVSEKRQAILDMKDDTLTKLFKEKPDVRSQINTAPGYGVFSNANVNIILASFGGGYGVVKNNKTGKYTYMKMGEVGLGLGAGIKDFRLVFIFHAEDVMDRFVNKGWAFGGQADAAAKAGDKGAAVGREATIDNITIYPLTESGLALQAIVKGTKFWKDDSLN